MWEAGFVLQRSLLVGASFSYGVRVRFRIRVQPVVGDGLLTVNVVPPVTGELWLIEERPVGAQKGGSLVAIPAIIAHMVRLATGFHIGVDARPGGYRSATETCLRHRMVCRVISAWLAGNFGQMLLLLVMGPNEKKCARAGSGKLQDGHGENETDHLLLMKRRRHGCC